MQHIQTKQLIDGTGKVVDGATITVDDAGRIQAVNGQRPQGATLVDWSAYTVMPGMIDAHDHLTIDLGDEAAQSKESVTTHVLRAVRNAKRILRAGITTVRDVGAKGYIDVEMRDATARGEMDGPRLLVSGQFITRTGGHAWYFADEADGVQAIRSAVRKQDKHGVDLIKIMATGGIGTAGSDPRMPGYSSEEIAAATEEAHALGYRIAAHIHGGPAATWAVEAGIDTLEHGIYLTEEQLQAMAHKGTYLVVTYGLLDEALRGEGIPDFFRRKSTEAKASYMNVLRRAVALGVRIAVGGDTYHADMPDELDALVQAGMSPMDAIRAATYHGADACGILAETGSVEVGKLADLVALGSDPLAEVRAVGDVRGVMKQGSLVV